MRKKLSNIILVLILLVGVGLLVYPTFSDWWNSFHQTRAIAGYAAKVANMDREDFDRMWAEAEAFNARLRETPGRFSLSKEEIETYNKILDVTGTGIMGYIDIPSIKVSLPIYHGTDESILQIAIGHIIGTSFPIGGEGSHCAVSGHRGLPSAKLFTDLDRMVEGDIFTVNVLDDILTYEVEKILIILPDHTEELSIIPQKDYVTLMTCTPYGVNSHRLLIRAHRIDTIYDRHIRVPADALQLDRMTVIPVVFVIVLILMGIVSAIFNRNKRIIRIDKYITAKLPSGDFEKHEKQSSDIE